MKGSSYKYVNINGNISKKWKNKNGVTPRSANACFPRVCLCRWLSNYLSGISNIRKRQHSTQGHKYTRCLDLNFNISEISTERCTKREKDRCEKNIRKLSETKTENITKRRSERQHLSSANVSAAGYGLFSLGMAPDEDYSWILGEYECTEAFFNWPARTVWRENHTTLLLLLLLLQSLLLPLSPILLLIKNIIRISPAFFPVKQVFRKSQHVYLCTIYSCFYELIPSEVQ